MDKQSATLKLVSERVNGSRVAHPVMSVSERVNGSRVAHPIMSVNCVSSRPSPATQHNTPVHLAYGVGREHKES
jgi:hypothetical protein